MKKITIITGLACVATIGSIFGTWVFGRYPETENRTIQFEVIVDDEFLDFGGGVEVSLVEHSALKVGPAVYDDPYYDWNSLNGGYYLYPESIVSQEDWEYSINNTAPKAVVDINFEVLKNFPNDTYFQNNFYFDINVKFGKETGLNQYFDLSELEYESCNQDYVRFDSYDFYYKAKALKTINNEQELEALIDAANGEYLVFEVSVRTEYFH